LKALWGLFFCAFSNLFVKKVVQDLTSGGLLGVWGKWMKHAKYIYNIQDFNPEQVLAVPLPQMHRQRQTANWRKACPIR